MEENSSLSPSYFVALVFQLILSLVICLGNCLILLAVKCSKDFTRITRHLIGHIAVADLTYGVVLAMHVVLELGSGMIPETCVVAMCLTVITSAASGFGICLVLVENYLSVQRINSQSARPLSLRVARGCIVGFWLIVAVLCIVYFFTLPTFEHNGAFTCAATGAYFTKTFFVSMFTFLSLILALMVCLMVRMLVAVRQSTKNLFREENSANKVLKQRSMEKSSRLSRLFTIISMGFVVSWAPALVGLGVLTMCPNCMDGEILEILFIVNPVNALANAVVYVIKDKRFRRVCVRILRCQPLQVGVMNSSSNPAS